MLVSLFVFVVVTGFIVGGYLLAVYVPRALEQKRLERRLQEVSAPAPNGDGDPTIVAERQDGPLPVLDRAIETTSAGTWLTKLIVQADAKTTPGAVILTSLMFGLGLGFILRLFLHSRLLALAGFLIGVTIPLMRLLRRRSVRLRKFEEQFPEALDLLARSIRAGHAFQAGMGMVASELTDPVGPEFKRSFDQQNYGLPLREALNELADRIPLVDVKFFVTAVSIQRDTGGNLAEILDNLAGVVRERFKLRRQIRVHTAHGRFTGYVLLALPAVLAAVLTFLNPDVMQPLFYEPIGQMLLTAAIVMQTIGYFWIRQVIKIEV